MSATGNHASNASSGASSRSRTGHTAPPPPGISNQPQSISKRTASLPPAPTSSAGASSLPSTSSRVVATQNSLRMASNSSRTRSPTRFVSSLRTPVPPQQEINEKVRDALEDLELGNISPSQAVYSAQQFPSRTGRSHAPGRSRSQEHSRGCQEETASRNANEREWDEKRGLGISYGNGEPTPGPSNTRRPLSPQQARSGTIQAPARSSSLTTASFVRHPCAANASLAPPPPYTSLPSFSSSALPSYPNNYAPYSLSVRRMLLIERIRPWLPFMAYAATIIGFALAIAFWKDEVFGGLDDLARWLRAEGETGYAVMFFMIFITCIPPVPLYSTLQILSGYTFGAWIGGVVSYFSALAGAVFVFWISRSIPSLRCAITSCMSRSRALQRVVRAISKRPSLLFLVRLAPYPYNVLNALLAGCPRLSFRTYVSCTALSLLKVLIHTSVGAGIKNFAEYHSSSKTEGSKVADASTEGSSSSLNELSTILGIVLCVAIAIYLTYVARRAVDEELDEDDDDDVECARGRPLSRVRALYGVRADDEESVGFLDESHGEGLGPDFASFASVAAAGRNEDRTNTPAHGEMTERDNTGRLGASSPVPLSSLSATPYGPPEWSQ